MTTDTKLHALICREIARALAATGKIDPRYVGAVAALLAERTQFEIADDGSIAVCDTGRALEAVVGDWVIGPEAAPSRASTGPGNGRAPAAPAGKRKSEMTNSEKGAYIAKHGLVAYQQLS